MSLEQIQSYVDEQRKKIEAELEKRRKSRAIDNKENQSPFSEGPLSSSASSLKSPKLLTSSSAKESSSGNETDEKKKLTSVATRRRSHGTILNKSSSSGTTTTSGSVATAELLLRLKRLEMPSLERPPPRRFGRTEPQTSADDMNTSADLMKAPDLDSSGDEDGRKAVAMSTFRFSTEFEEASVSSEEKEITRITLSTSNSS